MRRLRHAPGTRGDSKQIVPLLDRSGVIEPQAQPARFRRRIPWPRLLERTEAGAVAEKKFNVARRAALPALARALTAMGVLSLVFGLFQSNIGNISERRSQRSLRSSLAEMLETGAGFPRDEAGKAIPIAEGSAVAALDVGKIDVHKVVVEGAGAESLKKGPGLTSNPVLPGQPGHTIIVGRRTTFGAPFRRLDQLRTGDEIQATTPYGEFRYEVREVREVDPGSATNLREARGSLMTLVTSHPPQDGGSALIVVATLDGDPSNYPNPERKLSGRTGAVEFEGNTDSIVGAIIAGSLLLASLLAADRMYRRWRRWPTYLLTTPLILALAFAWMENLSSLFPSSI